MNSHRKSSKLPRLWPSRTFSVVGGSRPYLWNAHCGLGQARVGVGVVRVSLRMSFKCTCSKRHHGFLKPWAWLGPLPHGRLRACLMQVWRLWPSVILIKAGSPVTFTVSQTLLGAPAGPYSSRRRQLEWVIQRGATRGSLITPLEVTVLTWFAQGVQVCVIVDRESRKVSFQRLHLRVVGVSMFHLHDMPILLGCVATFVVEIQVVSIETPLSVLFRCVVRSSIGFTGILWEGDEAIFFRVALNTASGSLIRGGWAFFP